MNVVCAGGGERLAQWLGVVRRNAAAHGLALAAPEGRAAATADGVPAFATIEDAIAGIHADVAIVSGHSAMRLASIAVEAGLSVVFDEAGSPNGREYLAFRELARARGATVRVPRYSRYARRERQLRDVMRSNRVGNIGLVSCVSRVRGAAGSAGFAHACTHGFVDLQSVAALLGSRPNEVIARSMTPAATEAFVGFEDGSRVHYSGRAAAAADEHEFWVEGVNGSLRSDGRGVWWRKRGWRFFAPLAIPLGGAVDFTGVMAAVLGELAAGRKQGAAPEAEMLALATVAAARESQERGAAVSLRELEAV